MGNALIKNCMSLCHVKTKHPEMFPHEGTQQTGSCNQTNPRASPILSKVQGKDVSLSRSRVLHQFTWWTNYFSFRLTLEQNNQFLS